MTQKVKCKHARITEVPGEPTIGPYYICKDCGANLNEREVIAAGHKV